MGTGKGGRAGIQGDGVLELRHDSFLHDHHLCFRRSLLTVQSMAFGSVSRDVGELREVTEGQEAALRGMEALRNGLEGQATALQGLEELQNQIEALRNQHEALRSETNPAIQQLGELQGVEELRNQQLLAHEQLLGELQQAVRQGGGVLAGDVLLRLARLEAEAKGEGSGGGCGGRGGVLTGDVLMCCASGSGQA